MFYFPDDRVKIALYTLKGKRIWMREMHRGVINGSWFCPVFPFDLDQDGSDEIYFVNRIDSVHVLSYKSYRLEALSAKTGETIGQWPWKNGTGYVPMSHLHRNFIYGAFVQGQPVLITAQGTYSKMSIQAWNKGMQMRWERPIAENEPGARGSHMTPVVDIDGDGTDEILWGERCISADDGRYLFIADKRKYNGHSDVIQPVWNAKQKKWFVFTCRETGDKGEISPRVVMFNDKGKRFWTDLDQGHMDMGWTARTSPDGNFLAFTIARGDKIAGPDGFLRTGIVEYAYEAFSGKKVKLPFPGYNTLPVDLNGDGIHEFASALGEQSDRNIYSLNGRILGNLGEQALIAMASKFLPLPGEQLLAYYPDRKVRIWAWKGATDSKTAQDRYAHPFYRINQIQTAMGYNLVNLGEYKPHFFN
jgi:hypothetical protein